MEGVGNLSKTDSGFQCDFQTVSVSSELLLYNHYIKYDARLSRYDRSLHILAFLYLNGFCSFLQSAVMSGIQTQQLSAKI